VNEVFKKQGIFGVSEIFHGTGWASLG